MAKHDRSHDASVLELLFDEIRTFRKESREDIVQLEKSIEGQNALLASHSEQLVKLVQVIHGNGNKGLVDRIDALETTQIKFEKKFTEIETREKVRAALLALICTICSSIGGIIAYAISIYSQLTK